MRIILLVLLSCLNFQTFFDPPSFFFAIFILPRNKPINCFYKFIQCKRYKKKEFANWNFEYFLEVFLQIKLFSDFLLHVP